MSPTRREFLVKSGAAVGAIGVATAVDKAEAAKGLPMIIDTHQHLWDLDQFSLPWLVDAPELLRKSYRTADYLAATEGLDVRAVYMEVDVDPAQHEAEADFVVGLCHKADTPTLAGVVGGRPASEGFTDYVRFLKQRPEVKGIRQVLHGKGTPPGTCVAADFVRGVRLLGENGLRFDLCMRPTDLGDAIKLAAECPDTRFVLDHCGNADPKAFRAAANGEKPAHDVDAWRRAISGLADRPNVICKISGIVASAPKGWSPGDLAPIVNHCLDAFGPDRVVFGGDWPVCLLGATFRQWVDALAAIIADRPAADQTKLWNANAQRFYGLSSTSKS